MNNTKLSKKSQKRSLKLKNKKTKKSKKSKISKKNIRKMKGGFITTDHKVTQLESGYWGNHIIGYNFDDETTFSLKCKVCKQLIAITPIHSSNNQSSILVKIWHLDTCTVPSQLKQIEEEKQKREYEEALAYAAEFI